MTAKQQVIESIVNIVQQQAMVMAINDCYYLLGLLILVSGVALLFMKKTRAIGGVVAH